jgi:hypothetical protein
MPTMTKNWTPDPETAETFAAYRQAIETERALKPDVRRQAEAALKAGATGTQLARLTGMTPEVFRRMARDLDLPVDPRYTERAAASRKRPAAAEQPRPEPRERPSPTVPDWLDDFPQIAALTFAEAQDRAHQLKLDRPHWFLDNRKACTAEPRWINHAMLAADAADPENTPTIDAPATANPDRTTTD